MHIWFVYDPGHAWHAIQLQVTIDNEDSIILVTSKKEYIIIMMVQRGVNTVNPVTTAEV